MGNKAVFLDRDGVIIHDTHHLTKLSQVHLISGSASGVKLLNRYFKVIVVSNQSVVARGVASRKDINSVNKLIQGKLASQGAHIDAFYICPHHPEENGVCKCRKPNIGLLLKAKSRFNLDLNKCFFVGDKTSDIKTGKNAGCITLLVKTGYAGADKEFNVSPDFIKKNLLGATKKIIELNRLCSTII